MSRKIVVIIALVFAVAVILVTANIGRVSTSTDDKLSNGVGSVQNGAVTVAEKWQWPDTDAYSIQNEQLVSKQNLPFTPQSVYDALQAVKVDADGNIILDHDALLALDEALQRLHNLLDADTLYILQKLITEALPGKVGEQTAQVVADYYYFLEAQQEFSRMDKLSVDTRTEQTFETVEYDQALYSELQSLREAHLGVDATASLFRVSDANAKYMFDTMKLKLDNSLTAQQKLDMREKIQAEFTENSVNIEDWPARYKEFMRAKQIIIASSITEEQKRAQVTELLVQRFSAAERASIEYLGLDQI